MGEVKNNAVGGFHNWYRFYKQEKSGNINYLGYLDHTSFNGVRFRVQSL